MMAKQPETEMADHSEMAGFAISMRGKSFDFESWLETVGYWFSLREALS